MPLSDKEILELQSTVEQLKQAQADNWWHGLLIAVVGGAIAAIPTIWIAYISRKRDREIFQMTKNKEESVIKSKLFGEVKIAEHSMYVLISDLIREYVEYIRRDTLTQRYPTTENKTEVVKWLAKYEELARDYIAKKGEFSRVIYEYNYFVRDEKIDTLLKEFNAMTFPIKVGFENATDEELVNSKLPPAVTEYENTQYVRFSSAIQFIVNHIMDSKK